MTGNVNPNSTSSISNPRLQESPQETTGDVVDPSLLPDSSGQVDESISKVFNGINLGNLFVFSVIVTVIVFIAKGDYDLEGLTKAPIIGGCTFAGGLSLGALAVASPKLLQGAKDLLKKNPLKNS